MQGGEETVGFPGTGRGFPNELYFRNAVWPLVHVPAGWASLSSATDELRTLLPEPDKVQTPRCCCPHPLPQAMEVPVNWALLFG